MNSSTTDIKIEKIYNIHASDNHFLTSVLPVLIEKAKLNTKIVMFIRNNLLEKLNTFIDNFFNEYKELFFNNTNIFFTENKFEDILNFNFPSCEQVCICSQDLTIQDSSFKNIFSKNDYKKITCISSIDYKNCNIAIENIKKACNLR